MRIRCPHCHQPVELVDDVELEEIDCPSCGSHFNLLGQATAPHHADGPRRLGHFELVDRLGVGRFGAVWMARDTELDRTVAIKIPRQEHLSQGDIEMFLREARAAAQLHHPNIVGVHEIGRDGDAIYIVSDLIRGVTLADRLTAGRLSAREACALGATIAEALDHAHQSGVVHRDLKPSNIMLDAQGQPHLMDFGLAKREAAEITMTMDGRILGTPAYMSPEQARGDAHLADCRTDVYSLGTILFELLTGHLPFRGNSRMLLMQILHDEPPSPRKIDAAVPRDLETICLKCLEKRPERRYPTARAVADELRRWLANQPIQARPIGRAERVWRWSRRNPLVAGLATAVALALVAVTVISTAAAHSLRIEQGRNLANLQRAERAERDAVERLRESYLAQARARRASGQTGQRFASLDALRAAMNIREGDDLRDEAIACLALTDLQEARQWNGYLGGQTALAIDCDFQRYARSNADGVIQVRQIDGDRHLCTLPSPGGGQHAWNMGFSPDGQYLAAVHHPQTLLRVWHLPTAKLMVAENIARNFDFHPDKPHIAFDTPASKNVRVYDLSKRSFIAYFATRMDLPAFAYHPNGRAMAVSQATPWSVEVFNMASGREPIRISSAEGGPKAKITRLAWGQAGRLLAATCADNNVYVYDMLARRLQSVLRGHQAKPTDVVFNRRGDLLATTGWDETIRLWDPSSGRQLLVHEGGASYYPPAFSADGQLFGPTVSGGRISLWRIANGGDVCASLGRTSVTGELKGMDFSRDGRLLATVGGTGEVELWDVRSRQFIASLPQTRAVCVRFDRARDGLLVGGSSGLHRWPIRIVAAADSGNSDVKADAVHIGPPESLGIPAVVSCISLDATGEVLAATRRGFGQAVVCRRDGAKIKLESTEPSLEQAILSPDARWLATGTWFGGATGKPKVWDATTGKLLRALPDDLPSADCNPCFSADGRWLAIARREQVCCWRVASWEPAAVITKSFKRWNAAPAFTPDGSLLALAQARDEIRFVDPDTGRQAVSLTLAGPRTIDSVAFSKAGAYLAVRRTDLVQLWDLRSLARQLKAMRLEWPASLGAEKEMPPLPAKAVVHDADGAMTVWEETGEPQRIAAVLAAKGAEEPADAGGFAGRGIQRATAKQYEEAILDLTRAIELQSDNDDCWRWRGWSHHALGQIPQAIADYSKYLRRHPRDRETWDRLAACHAESGDLAQAAVDTRQAIEAGGDVAESLRHYVLLAIARRSTDDYRWACDALLARAGSPKPGDSLTYRRQLVWACTLEVEAEPLSAALEIARADAGKPGRARDYDLAEGALLYRAGRIHEAIGILQAALSEKSLSTAQAVYGWLFLARALQQAGESAGAYQALDKAKNAGQTASTALSWCHDLELRLLQSAIDEMAATFESGEKPPAGEIKPDRPSTPAG